VPGAGLSSFTARAGCYGEPLLTGVRRVGIGGRPREVTGVDLALEQGRRTFVSHHDASIHLIRGRVAVGTAMNQLSARG